MKKIFSPLLFTIFSSIALFVVVQVLGSISFVENIANTVNDVFTYRIQYTQNKHNDDIVIIKIDDRTLNTLGKSDLGMSAFDKGEYATVIQHIFETYDAAVLGIDIVFANPSVLGKEDEEKLKTALETYKDTVVIATRSDYNPHPLCLYSGVQHGAIDTLQQEKIRSFKIAPFLYDIEKLCSENEIYEGNKKSISTFSQEILNLYKEYSSPFEKEDIEEKLKVFSPDTRQTAYIDYFSNGKKHEGTLGYDSYSFIDIYNQAKTTPEGRTIDLKGKIVLLGEVGTLMHDSHLTPLHQSIKMPGVEINANIINTLKEGKLIQDASFLDHSFIFIFLQIFVILGVMYFRTFVAVGVLCLSILILVGFGGWMFILGERYDIFLGVLGCFLSFLVSYVYRFQVSDRAKRMLKKQFSLYVSADVVEEISKHPEAIMMQGEKREMSIFFSDIVSFTDISESLDPEKVVILLNEYFSEMTKIIHKNKGTLDKYIGDSVMCFFNAPISQENHSFYACKTALEQQKRLKELNQIWKIQGYPEIQIRIGLHTGEAVHGNIGSTDTRVSYTVIGDSVNLASRLEGVCKEYGVHLCVSEAVYKLQKEAFHFRELDTIAVKGKKQAVKIYQLIGLKSVKIPEQYQQYFENYAQGLLYYKETEYRKAGEIWLKNKIDPASYHMAQRCRDILDGKAQVEQGVFIMSHK